MHVSEAVESDHRNCGQTADPASKAPTNDGRILRRARAPTTIANSPAVRGRLPLARSFTTCGRCK
jgi:hypothetical protein